MTAIVKSEGVNSSERFLARLAERSFLSLWSYPNVYRDVGKELCDLLIVCGSNIIVFSDKEIAWPSSASSTVAWNRWYRNAVAKSAKQLSRAISWIRSHPDRLYLDAVCRHKFPIDLPIAPDAKIHAVVVARGASIACRNHFGSGSGSLGLAPMSSRTRTTQETPQQHFFVGNPSPNEQDIYHVLDDITLPILLRELDTVIDLTDYFDKRSSLIAGGHLLAAHGEEDLLAVYLKDINEEGDHDFVNGSGKKLAEGDFLVINGGSYEYYRKRPEYRRKLKANQVSYIWDSLIERFATNIIRDSSYIVRGYEDYYEPSKRELGLRQMALVSRLERRHYSMAIDGAFRKIKERGDRFFRLMIPPPEALDRSRGFFILLVKRKTAFKDLDDEQYRVARANLMFAYAMNILRLCPFLKIIVGIATEGELGGAARSEDLVYAEQPIWTAEYRSEIQEEARRMDILQHGIPDDKSLKRMGVKEYPPSHHARATYARTSYEYTHEPSPAGNRKQRRSAAAARRRRSRG